VCYKRRVAREFSAGGVLVNREDDRWAIAAIRPAGKPPGTWALPKGVIDAGEAPERTAAREVTEETGAAGELVGKLGDIRYVYSRRGGERVFKVVSFYLLRYAGGELGAIAPEQRREVAETRWLPLDEAPRLLAYPGERQIAEKARALLESDNAPL
jgi:8-oxo-dGTP pyrophosphatase MutT (NUDIX family)